MPRRLTELLGWLILASWLAQSVAAPADSELRGDIRFTPASTEPVWVGQEIELQLDLWSNGLSFGDQLFVLPEAPGGFLLQGDSTTVKLTENRDGVTWQGLRYSLLFYPQTGGRLEVPPFEVRFTARAGFGGESEAFRFITEPLILEARLPEGASPGGLLVTTSAFSLESSWSRQVPQSGPLRLLTGDALTLEVRRRADEVPGMVFPPLPRVRIEGLGEYPAAPVVEDRANRGALTGFRTDAVTFVCEAAGTYEIPEWRFQWWDPEREVLAERMIPALQLEVSSNPAYATATGGRADALPRWWLLAAGIAMLSVLAIGWFAARPLAGLMRGWIEKIRTRRATRKRTPGLLQPLNPRS